MTSIPHASQKRRVKKTVKKYPNQTERRGQLAKALKANLKRRKAQALARSFRTAERKP